MRADPSVLEAESVAEGYLLVVAAWWHDLGYAPEIRVTGMHQIDGARYLTGLGYSPRLCALVACPGRSGTASCKGSSYALRVTYGPERAGRARPCRSAPAGAPGPP
jgi:hypothetical protein